MLGRWLARLRHRPSSEKQQLYVTAGFAVIATAGVSVYAAPEHADHLRASLRDAWGSFNQEVARATQVVSEHAHATLQVSIAHSIAGWASEPDKRELLIHFGGSPLLRWLVRNACDDPSALQAECEGALVQLLQHEDSAPDVLKHCGVVPSLLEHIAAGKATDELVHALHSATACPSLSYLVSPSDVRRTLSLVQGRHGGSVQHLAAALLGAWARASPVNRRKLAACGAYATLADVAVAASHQQGTGARDLLRSLVATLSHVAGSEAAWEGPHLACWVQPALYVAADAVMAGDTALAQQALGAMRHLAMHGGEEVQQQLQSSPLLPLLHRLAEGGRLKEEVGSMVGALAASGLLASKEVPPWRDRLLSWLMQPQGSEAGNSEDSEGDGEAVRHACVQALEALCAPSGPEPNHVSYYWLAGILDHLAATLLAPRGPTEPLPRPGAPAAPTPPPQPNSWQESVLVQPAYARWVAADLRLAADGPESTTGQAPTPPPAPLLELLGPEASAAYPAAARIVDAALAQQKLGTALEVLNRMVADDTTRQAALVQAGILPLLGRLCLDQPPPAKPRAPRPPPSPQPTAVNFQQDQSTPALLRADAPATLLSSTQTDSPTDATPSAATSQPSRFQWLFSRLRSSPPAKEAPAPAASQALSATRGTHPTASPAPASGADLSAWGAQAMLGGAEQGPGGDLWVAADAGGAEAALVQGEGEAASMQAAALLAAKQLEQEEAVDHPPAPLAIQRQAARLLALLVLQVEPHPVAKQQLEASGWLPWLEQAAQSPDCTLSSHAMRALLHLAATMSPSQSGDPGEEAGEGLPPPSNTAEARAVCLDGVHLMSPDACHHWTLAAGIQVSRRQQGMLAEFLSDLLTLGSPDAAATCGDDATDPGCLLQRVAQRCRGSSSQPLLDVVFIHGIRGGPFVTWRKREVGPMAAGRSSVRRESCWVNDWLAPEVPEARLLSVEYVAPVSFWEGESMPLVETARQVSQKLLAAGVGQRPVVFVGHSMGGLIVKEMLAQALAELDPTYAPPDPFLHPPPHPQQQPQQPRGSSPGAATAPVQPRRWWPLSWWWGGSSGIAAAPAASELVVVGGAHGDCPGGPAGGDVAAAAIAAAAAAAAGTGPAAGSTAAATAHTDPPVHTVEASTAGGSMPRPAAPPEPLHQPQTPSIAAASDPSAADQSAAASHQWPAADTPATQPDGQRGASPAPGNPSADTPRHSQVAADSKSTSSTSTSSGAQGRPQQQVTGSSQTITTDEPTPTTPTTTTTPPPPTSPPTTTTTTSSGGTHHTPQQLLDKARAASSTDTAATATSTTQHTLQQLLDNTCAIVFYSTPHFGSSLAAYGWKLRYIGGAPAPSIAYLSPGPHLEHINDCLRRLHDARRLKVLSVCEGLPTQLAGFIPQVHIVPPYSSNPGFGEVAMVEEDHIACCKPRSKEDPIFRLLLRCIQSVVADIAEQD